MIIQRQEDVTIAVTEAFKNTSDPRVREILLSLVKHLHAFTRETHLTEEEWEARQAEEEVSEEQEMESVEAADIQ